MSLMIWWAYASSFLKDNAFFGIDDVPLRKAEFEKLGFCTITGLPVGVTQEMFDEANRQARMNRQKGDKDNEPDRLTAHLGETRQTI